MTTPEELDGQVTLRTAVARYERLWARYSAADDVEDRDEEGDGTGRLPAADALELLALGEVIARKAGYGRQLAVRAARAAGASWSQVGQALGTTKQAAWEAHTRWLDQQAQQAADGAGHEPAGDRAVG